MMNPIIKRIGRIAGVLVVVLAILGAAGIPASSPPRVLRKEVVVRAPIEAVWEAWTTVEGLKFFSKESNVELRLGGPYELFLQQPADKRGRRGAEGCRILAFVPHEMLAFDWTFPPDIPSLRYSDARTQAVVYFEDIGGGRVRVRFSQSGWEEGENWDQGFAYFDKAWGWVMEQLEAHFEAEAG
jgi:uncharacterized protein YndB with AHSA1/START domain